MKARTSFSSLANSLAAASAAAVAVAALLEVGAGVRLEALEESGEKKVGVELEELVE